MDLENAAKNATIESFSQLEAAERQIDGAISLFINEKNYICAVTLAGAAEGILGEALVRRGVKPLHEHMKSFLQQTVLPELTPTEISRQYLNKIRNHLKHFSERQDGNIEHAMDFEAITLILRAIGNHWLLTQTFTTRQEEFFRWLREFRPEILEEAGKFDGSKLKLE